MKRKFWASKKKETAPPRAADEINKEYGVTCSQLGQTVYQIELLTGKKVALQNRVHELVQENEARSKLDAETPEKDADVKPEPSKG